MGYYSSTMAISTGLTGWLQSEQFIFQYQILVFDVKPIATFGRNPGRLFRVKGWLTIAVGFYFAWGNELCNPSELHEISTAIFSKKHCAISVNDVGIPADINTTTKNIHLISNCTEIKAERFAKI